MKQPWWALLIVGVLGVGIGVGSAVLVGDDTVESSPAVTTAPAATAPGDTTPASTQASTTGDTTTVADPAPATTAAPSTTGAPESTTPATTEPPAATTTTEPDIEQPPIEELVVAVANGAVGGGASGLAGATAELIRTAGYPNVVVTNGTQPFGGTVIYVADGLQPSAERLVDDIQALDPEFVEPAFIVPLADAPATTPALEDVDMILYLGQDQV